MNIDWYNKFIMINSFRDKTHNETAFCFKGLFDHLLFLYKNNKFVTQKDQYTQYIYNNSITFSININRINDNGDFRINACTNKISNEKFVITINLLVYNDFNEKKIEKLKCYLFNIVKHEIWHVYDMISGKETKHYNIDDSNVIQRAEKIKTYMLSETEIIPFIVGIMSEAKKSNKKFEDILNEILDFSLYNSIEKVKIDDLTKKQIDIIKKQIHDYIINEALNRYPLFKKRYTENSNE